MYRFLMLFVGVPFISCAQNQIKVVQISPQNLPPNLSYKGKVKDAYQWSDKDGDHLTLITETGEFPSPSIKEEDYRDAELFGYDFLIQKDSIEQSWKIYDFIKDCPVDIKANFVRNALRITDLNSDGKGEVWFIYKVACYGDVSPAEMKLVMHQGQQKYIMRGRSRVKIKGIPEEGGEYKFDNAFLSGQEQYRAYAKQLWNDNINEIWE